MNDRPIIHALVIRKDGTVPFDDDYPEGSRENAIAWLNANGHAHDPVPGTRHVKIKVWPPVKA
jgi:hypothetical protein